MKLLEKQLFLGFYDYIVDEKLESAQELLEDPFLDIEQLEAKNEAEDEAEFLKTGAMMGGSGMKGDDTMMKSPEEEKHAASSESNLLGSTM